MGESLCPDCRLYPICGRVNRAGEVEQQTVVAVDEDCQWYEPRPEGDMVDDDVMDEQDAEVEKPKCPKCGHSEKVK